MGVFKVNSYRELYINLIFIVVECVTASYFYRILMSIGWWMVAGSLLIPLVQLISIYDSCFFMGRSKIMYLVFILGIQWYSTILIAKYCSILIY